MTIYERLWRQVVPNIVLIIAQAIIFLSLMETRPGRKKAIRLTVLFTAAVIFVYTFGLFYWDARPSTQWSLLTQTLPALLFFWWLSKYRDIRFLATYCMSDVSIATIDFTFYVLLAQIFGVDNSFWSFPIRCAAMIAGCLLIRRFVSGRYTTALRYLKRGWGLILTVVVLDYAVMALLSAYPTPIAKRPNDLPMCIIVMFFMLTMIFVMIAMIGNMLRAQQLELEEQDLTAGLRIAKQQYESLQDSVEQERVLSTTGSTSSTRCGRCASKRTTTRFPPCSTATGSQKKPRCRSTAKTPSPTRCSVTMPRSRRRRASPSGAARSCRRSCQSRTQSSGCCSETH